MKYIVKGDEPKSFQRWRQQNPQANWSVFSGTSEHVELREELIRQQDKMCCYCEVALKGSADAHVEHLKDKHNHPNAIFDYNNLLASCDGQRNDSCGHKKGTGYFNGMVSPLNADCESRFTYTGIGTMIPSDETDVKAKDTIDLLGLNCKRLKGRRESIIKALENADSDYLQQSLDFCVDWYNGFFTVVKYMVDKRN